MLPLRDYQEECLAAIWRAIEGGVPSALTSLATGAGKTVLAVALMRQYQERFGGRTLFLVHREELLLQTLDKLSLVWPECDAGAVQASRDDYHAEHVVVGSVQTLINPARRAKTGAFQLIITDECHHAVSKTYRELYDYYQPTFHLGITATTRRTDNKALARVYQELVYHIGTLELIARGYLCDVRYRRIRTNTSLHGVGSWGEDFHPGTLDTVVNVENRNDLIAEAYNKYGEGRRGIAFCTSVAHAHTVADNLIQHGVAAEVVSGKTPHEKRAEILDRARRGETKIIANFGVLVEGFDDPGVEILLMARPTKSDLVYSQMIGRALRTFPGKQDALVLDFTDDDHDVCSLPTLLGLTEREPKPLAESEATSVVEELRETERRQGLPPELKLGLGTTAVAGDIFKRSRLTWRQDRDSWVLDLPQLGKLVVAPHPNRPGAFAILHQHDRQADSLTLRPVPADYALAVGEAKAQELLKGRDAIVRRDAPWRLDPISPGQIAFIQKLAKGRVRIPAHATKGWAAQTIEALKDGSYWQRFRKGHA